MMLTRRSTWLSRCLFWLTLALAAALIVLVLLAPLLDNGRQRPAGWPRYVAAFARAPALRRTALASALGLAVTACVFFRPPGRPRPRIRRAPRRVPPPPPDIAGA